MCLFTSLLLFVVIIFFQSASYRLLRASLSPLVDTPHPWPIGCHDLQLTGRNVKPGPDFRSSTNISSDYTPESGETITLTISLINSGLSVNETITLTNVLPNGLNYIAGSLKANFGTIDDSRAPTL